MNDVRIPIHERMYTSLQTVWSLPVLWSCGLELSDVVRLSFFFYLQLAVLARLCR